MIHESSTPFPFDISAFEKELVATFPELRMEIDEDKGLLHLHFASLYRLCQNLIKDRKWEELGHVFRFVDSCASRNFAEVENAVSVSFLEHFDFHEHEKRIKEAFGQKLVQMYDEQMKYLSDLNRLSQSSFEERIGKREKGKNALFACPCCGYATLGEPGAFEICSVCFWEDDGQDDPIDDIEIGGPNKVSLAVGRMNFIKFGASDPKDKGHARPPSANEELLREYKIDGDRVIRKN
jgi:hypothetical protein